MRVVLLTLPLALGCVRVEPAATRGTSPQPAAQPAPAARPAKPAAPAPVVRDLDAAAVAELGRAFADNQVAARKHYAGTRWRFVARPDDIFTGGARVVTDVVGDFLVSFRAGEVEKLVAKRPATVEAVADYFDPNVYNGIAFKDATVAGD